MKLFCLLLVFFRRGGLGFCFSKIKVKMMNLFGKGNVVNV